MEKTFLDKHAAAMVCHRQEFWGPGDGYEDAFNALADYADELAAIVSSGVVSIDEIAEAFGAELRIWGGLIDAAKVDKC